MTIVCECGEKLKLICDKSDESNYTQGEGWYCQTTGHIDVWESDSAVGFVCGKCGREEWMFT